MKMRKPCKGRLVNVVLKNAKFWNGKSFELQNEVRLNACETSETVEFDCNGALVMPALFGLGLDFMEPLRDDVYTFADGFDALRKGGFYGGLYESAANPIDDADKYTAMVNRFKSEERGEDAFDIKFLGAYSKGFGSDSLAEMVELAEAGVAGFGDGNGVIPHSRFLRLAMEYGKMTGKRFFFQPMDKTLRHSGCVHEGAYSDMLGMKGIPRIAETIAAYTVLETARFLQVPVHFKQVTCGETLELVRNARKNGIDVTCDVNLYHLLLDDSCLETLDSAYHILPPIRSAGDREALWQGVVDGTVNAISVNHTPVLRQDTVVNFEDSVPGALSLEVALPAIWNKLVASVGEARAIELLSTAPARLAGAESAGESVVVLAPEKTHKVLESDFAGHVCNSPLTGKVLPSSILASYINGVWTEL
ncbi:amidohydrolase family protein [Fibrobacter succinogenes]|uniref:Dihydroorotase n=1 Tax=Fibrobacter succinogenes TaxID=833 RepID=A0A380RY53_FIBSU|nr:dihydroorotase [Fibrobacter succinogenes]PWJ37565.1 dihydroorotase [Fibrobacter succinogenes subsp. elongatus]SUQ19812.1 dihydroorotase [Fibrobacter succinogenes]